MSNNNNMSENRTTPKNRNIRNGQRSRTRRKKRKINYKSLCKYITFTLVFSVITAPLTLLYGPFENAKKMFVGTAMDSMNYKWLATTFLSQEKIDEILTSNDSIDYVTNVMTTKDDSFIEISPKKDNSIELKQISDENDKFKGYALIIDDPSRVKVGVSSKIFKEGESVSQIAENYDAVAAINGGYFTQKPGEEEHMSNGAIPTGFLMSEGKIIQDIDRDKEEYIVAITKEGRMLIGQTTVKELLAKKENDKDTVTEAMSYTTTLIKNGKEVPIEKDEGSSPKTMIGQRQNGQIVMVVLDSNFPGGRLCATVEEARTVMKNLGCYNAAKLDGGKSTTMYLNGEVINNPSYPLGERRISAGFIVK